ncbi:radical SAM protein [Synechococcus sp. BS55D]|uniref:radical SAM protein n=1 Tax=Synechococcus sp. BS55D TaxID=2055943 RepID=UPI001039C31D|nr:radical SAM/SPASM domain-containing protein [Synechococcus sp. BS55D]TCD58085.1 hypothetical protein CWE16_01945 [Synechococcus sp. BS55D]
MAKTLKHIKEASIEINGACNYSCPSCPQSAGREIDFKKSLPLDLYQKILNDLKSHGCTSISLQGSGEPFLQRNVGEYIERATALGIDTHIITNGSMLDESIAEDCVRAGLNSIRFSILGFDADTYRVNMGTSFDIEQTLANIERFIVISKGLKSECRVSLYHLIIPSELSISEQVQRYKELSASLDVEIEIWHSHNWAGRNPSSTTIDRSYGVRRSCGRPQAEYLTVRAGGSKGFRAAVVPCCFVLGRDSEAELGNLEMNTIQEVLDSTLYQELLEAHRKNEYAGVAYCEGCDQLYETKEALVWSNSPTRVQGLSHTASREKPVRFIES